ncbi:glyoxylate/hydroxypyruvate reductase A [Roseivirga sp.]|uniref:2-hydroxyacid dehydrogenase n=1 Tax=Roseivirga sp. TaxID=1964215 RepID=UPI002B27AC71|nr:glyoxylate/hydroxypyruvate reductase A [Roseivirga sp.]
MGKQKIDILLSTSIWDPKAWIEGLSQSEYVSKIHVWPTEDDLSKVEALFVWKPLAKGVIEKLPNLKWISSLGAGVDHLMTDPQVPENIPITRIVDPNLTTDMANYVMMGVIMHQRSFGLLQQNQQKTHWERITYNKLRVGVMGLGELGGHLAKQLCSAGFEVSGYSRTQKQIEGVQCYDENNLDTFLSKLDVLVNLLPITPKTVGILNHELLIKTSKGCYLINVARGNHLVDNDLLKLLQENHLSGAMLDVFHQEPLPSDHPFWTHEKVVVTPHVASVTSPESAISLLKENIERLINGGDLLHQIDMDNGY